MIALTRKLCNCVLLESAWYYLCRLVTGGVMIPTSKSLSIPTTSVVVETSAWWSTLAFESVAMDSTGTSGMDASSMPSLWVVTSSSRVYFRGALAPPPWQLAFPMFSMGLPPLEICHNAFAPSWAKSWNKPYLVLIIIIILSSLSAGQGGGCTCTPPFTTVCKMVSLR